MRRSESKIGVELSLSRNIAYSAQNSGYNCLVTVTWPWVSDERTELNRVRFHAALNQIDHKALGVDLTLGPAFAEPNLVNLAHWIREELAQGDGPTKPSRVRLEQGNGISLETQ